MAELATKPAGQIIAEAIMPYSTGRLKHILENPISFVHYTSAESAVHIIRNKSFLLRNPRLMNDWSEIRHGRECWTAMWRGEAGTRLRALLDSIDPEIVQRFETISDEVQEELLDAGFVGSVSEHDPAQDSHGRLSMWRAYGASGGVALILNKDGFTGHSMTANLLSAPVQYVSPVEYADYMLTVASNLESLSGEFRDVEPRQRHFLLLLLYIFSLTTLKHKGFAEEREWRILHLPLLSKLGLMPQPTPSQISKEVMILNGQPQLASVLHFEGLALAGMKGLSPKELVQGIIVGPTAFPTVTADALAALMVQSGIDDAENKISYSLIPVRTNH